MKRRHAATAHAAAHAALLMCAAAALLGMPRAASAVKITLYRTEAECVRDVNGTAVVGGSGDCLVVPDGLPVASARATCPSASSIAHARVQVFKPQPQPVCTNGNLFGSFTTNRGLTCQAFSTGPGEDTLYFTADCSWVGQDGGHRVAFERIIDNYENKPCRYNKSDMDIEAVYVQEGECAGVCFGACNSREVAAVVTCDTRERSSAWNVRLQAGNNPCHGQISNVRAFDGSWDQCTDLYGFSRPSISNMGFQVRCGPGEAEPLQFSNETFPVAVSQFSDCVDVDPDVVLGMRNGVCFRSPSATGTSTYNLRAECTSDTADEASWRIQAFQANDTDCNGTVVYEQLGYADSCLREGGPFSGFEVACGKSAPGGDGGGGSSNTGLAVGLVMASLALAAGGAFAVYYRKKQEEARDADGARDWQSGTASGAGASYAEL